MGARIDTLERISNASSVNPQPPCLYNVTPQQALATRQQPIEPGTLWPTPAGSHQQIVQNVQNQFGRARYEEDSPMTRAMKAFLAYQSTKKLFH
jgi:hypothetical protein